MFILFFFPFFCIVFPFVSIETLGYFDTALWSPVLPLFKEKQVRDCKQDWSSPGDRTKDQMLAICCGKTAQPCPELEQSLLPGSRGRWGGQYLLLDLRSLLRRRGSVHGSEAFPVCSCQNPKVLLEEDERQEW